MNDWVADIRPLQRVMTLLSALLVAVVTIKDSVAVPGTCFPANQCNQGLAVLYASHLSPLALLHIVQREFTHTDIYIYKV